MDSVWSYGMSEVYKCEPDEQGLAAALSALYTHYLLKAIYSPALWTGQHGQEEIGIGVDL